MKYTKEITYFSADGFASTVRAFTNPQRPHADVVLLLPAMGTTAAYYSPFAEALVEAGYHVVTADWRGKGLSIIRAGRNADFGYREILHYDFPALFDCVRSEFPKNEIIVYGHSLGGQLGSIYLAAHPEEQVTGLVQHFSCHCHYKNWDYQSWKMYLWFKTFPWIARLFGYFPGEQVGFARREARTFMRDWGYSGTKGKYHPKGTWQAYDSLGHLLTTPILSFSLEGDQLAPRRGAEHLFGLFPNARVTHRHLPADSGERKPYSHFNWVHQPSLFIQQMKEWRGSYTPEVEEEVELPEDCLMEF
ncbi:alpha/beta hydrolase family protein [Flavilitoribacter nigricans]|nr:alpha/beta fold hydrolase [Flavilitoribacter nigricans]